MTAERMTWKEFKDRLEYGWVKDEHVVLFAEVRFYSQQFHHDPELNKAITQHNEQAGEKQCQ